MQNIKKISLGIILISTLSLGIVSAQGMPRNEREKEGRGPKPEQMMKDRNNKEIRNKDLSLKHFDGIVTSINGNILTISSNFGFKPGKEREEHKNSTTTASTTVFTIDATNATIIKNNATGSILQIALNDKVNIDGSASGTVITAKIIRDEIGNVNKWNKDHENENWSSTTASTTMPEQNRNFLNRMKNFFRNIFNR